MARFRGLTLLAEREPTGPSAPPGSGRRFDLRAGNVLVARRPDDWEASGVSDVENGIAADIDLAKTDYYSLGRGEPERSALFEGYGPLPADAVERLELYRLYHALELWDSLRSIGTVGPVGGIADDIARLAG
ncbi:hypothetical protein AB0A71_41935 [Kitasatospora aureofaciens]|uniref:hypothetical protein n=1 Tax=Kitasatospora aureofaciens TaxID=1894 RepID=UPI0033FE6D94